MIAPSVRVLFLTRYPVEGASSRYRVFQYLPHLRELGLECIVSSFMGARLYRLSIVRGHAFQKWVLTFHAVARRLWVLREWRSYDIIVMQRELLPFGPPLVERWLSARGATLVFDYDDALFIKKNSRYNRVASALRRPQKILELFRLCKLTIAGNDWLRDAAISAGGKSVTLEVAEDVSRFPKRCFSTSPSRVLTIGWLGSPSTVKYLRLIEDSLVRIASENPGIRWELMGGGEFEMNGVAWESRDWSMDAEVEALSRFDIGLMPLPDEEWAMGKSGGKARTYMAAGVVPVVTAVGYNLSLIEHGKTGFLCRQPSDWENTIQLLISDPDLRVAVASAARRDVEVRFSPVRQAARLADILVCEADAARGSDGL